MVTVCVGTVYFVQVQYSLLCMYMYIVQYICTVYFVGIKKYFSVPLSEL